jgi:hypothetical protein
MASSSKKPVEEPRISFKDTKPVRVVLPEQEERPEPEPPVEAAAEEPEAFEVEVERGLPEDEEADAAPTRHRPAAIKGSELKRTIARNISLDKHYDEMLFDLQLKISRHFNQRCKVSDLFKASIQMFSSMPMHEVEKHLAAFMAPRGRSRR